MSTFSKVKQSRHAERTIQKLSELTDKMKPSPSPKPCIKLSIGDPTVDGNLLAPAVLKEAMIEAVMSDEFNGYPPVSGYDRTREETAKYIQKFCSSPERKDAVKWKNVIITSGTSHAIVLSMTAIANEGDNILVTSPAFPHYEAVCDSYGIECRFFPSLPEQRWEVDFEATEKLIDERTRAMIIINPSNPSGANWSREHVTEVVRFCERHSLPLIADEIYAEVIFRGQVFTSVADIDSDVPRVILGGTAKHTVTPGWRIGWAALVDPANVAREWMKGMDSLAQLHTGANSICQAAFVTALNKVPASHLEHLNTVLESGAKVYERLLDHDIGLSFQRPTASMFVMIRVKYEYFKDINDDMTFYEKLLEEENVQVMPGEIFGIEGFIRATTSRPTEILNEACDRIIEFCERHKK